MEKEKEIARVTYNDQAVNVPSTKILESQGDKTNACQEKSDDHLIPDRVFVEEKLKISIPVFGRYSILSTESESIYSVNKGDFVADLRIYQMLYGNEVLGEFKVPDTNPGKRPVITSEYRKELVKAFTPILSSKTGEETAKKIEKLFLEGILSLPPWERMEPVRNIESEKYSTCAYACNDDGNALRFKDECAEYLIYDLDSKEWKAWETNHWESAESRLVQSERFVADSIRYELEPIENSYKLAVSSSSDKEAVKLLKDRVHELKTHINYSKKVSNLKAMAELNAASEMSIHLMKEGDSSLLACKNGIIDTNTGEFYPNEKVEKFKFRYPTHYIDCTYTKGQKPTLFLKHLHTIFCDNTTQDLRDHDIAWREADSVNCFKRLLGYLLIAGNPDQLFIFLWGPGANGKSTTMDVLREVLGVEISEAPSREIYATKEDKPTTGITRGLSQRILLFSELSDDESNTITASKVSTELIKNLTGDKKTAGFRAIYEGSSVRDIVCTPVALTNNLPHFDKELDDALLRRLITVPHQHIFKDEERDRRMVEKLIREKDAIFSLLVDEMIAYRNEGLIRLPEHWMVSQAQLLAGEAQYAFITETYHKTDGSTREKRTAMRNIESYYIQWCRSGMIDCSTVMKLSGVDANGYTKSIERLSLGELKKMYKAFNVLGYTTKTYDGSPYIWCEMKAS